MIKITSTACLVHLLFILSPVCSAQSYKWAFSAGSHIDDKAYGTATDQTGNVYITGNCSSGTIIGTYTFKSGGAFLAKFDSTGLVKFVKEFGTDETSGTDIVLDEEGNIYIIGDYESSFVIDGYKTPGGSQIKGYVLKLDPTGSFRWFKSFGSDEYNRTALVNSIALDGNKNIYVGGVYTTNIIIDGTKITAVGDIDMFLLKLDNESNL